MAANFNNLTNAAIFSGVSQSLARGVQENFTPEGQAIKAEARARKAAMDEKLRQTKALAPSDEDLQNQAAINTQELQKLKEENSQLLAKQTKVNIFDAFDRYTGDNDTRHLNTMLQDMRANPYGQKIFGKFTRVDKLTEDDKGMITKAGLDPELVMENPEYRDRIVKVTQNDGTQILTDMNQLFKMTGYTNYAQNKELELELKRANIAKAYSATGAKTAKERLAYDMTKAEGLVEDTPEFEARYIVNRAKLQAESDSKSGGGGNPATSYKVADEREAYRLTQQDGLEPNSSAGQRRFMEHYEAIQKRNRTPSAVKTADEVDATTEKVNEKAKALGVDFFDIDFSNRKNRLEFEPEIQRIEKLGGFELSADQRKELGYIKSLVKLGPPSLKLNDEETGLVDNILFNTKKYMKDEIGGLDATSSYATFRNTIRHALYGAALTESEIQSFEEQFGNLKQKRGPVLVQLKTAVEQIRSKLDGLESLGNSHVTHFRLGADNKALGTMVTNLDKLLEHLDSLEATVDDNTAVSTGAASKQTKPSLDDIFGGQPK